MAIILTIDTAGEQAGICLSLGDHHIQSVNPQQRDHAAWLQPAIRELFEASSTELSSLDAVAVTAGPGSYTGLRVALSSAKGLCYALGKPLITMSSLLVMAKTAVKQLEKPMLLCPMIDARRMEVFTALFDENGQQLQEAFALVLEPDSFDKWLYEKPVCFFGNGAEKYKNMLKNVNAYFENIHTDIITTAQLAAEMYAKQAFSDLAYTEPNYVKAFYSPQKAKS